MSSVVTFGAIVFGITLGVLLTYFLLHFVTDFTVTKKMSKGDVEGVKKALNNSAIRVSQPVRITAEVWLQNQRK